MRGYDMRRFIGASTVLAAVAVVLVFGGCGEKQTPYDTNLLTNESFEKVGADGLPEEWELSLFRGLPEQQGGDWEVDSDNAVEGKNSFMFKADPATERFHYLSQEIEIEDVSHVRLRGWMQTDQVTLIPGQYSQCNFLVTFYDEAHGRFQSHRVADKRTLFRTGTLLWFEEDQTFRVPDGTRYVSVSCILGTDGRVWFDNVSLSVPAPIGWEKTETRNYVYNWLPGNPPPNGAVENQQLIFDTYAQRLGVQSDVVVNYYFYPDTASIRDILSLKGHQYVSWPDREFHSVNPNEDHEVVHFITAEYGGPPRSIAEGTVFWLYGEWNGMPLLPLAAYLLANDMLGSLRDITSYNNFMILDADISMPTAASFVQYLATRYGTKKLMELYRGANGVNSYDAFAQVLEAVYGVPSNEIEQEYRAALAGIDYSVIAEQLGSGQGQ
jgi:hypothetical protein